MPRWRNNAASSSRRSLRGSDSGDERSGSCLEVRAAAPAVASGKPPKSETMPTHLKGVHGSLLTAPG